MDPTRTTDPSRPEVVETAMMVQGRGEAVQQPGIHQRPRFA